VVSVDGREYTTDRGKQSVVTTVVVAFTFADGDTGAMFRSEWAGQGDDPADKGLYKAYTGALKYFLMKTFLIPTGDDPEADTNTDTRSASRQRSPGRTTSGVTATEKQIGYLKKLVKQKGATTEQLNFMLIEVGAQGVQVKDGWTENLAVGVCSALIDWLKERPLPDTEHPSDVPPPAEGEFIAPPATAEENQMFEVTS
jgi:hypothetical protein